MASDNENDQPKPEMDGQHRNIYRAVKLPQPEQVLDPDSPLLQRFQETLREHLLRQIDILKNDIFEYETEAKKTNAEKEQLGIQIYEGQQIVAKQHNNISNYMKQLEVVKAAREETENVLKAKKEVHREKRNELMDAQQEEIKLRREIEGMNFLIQQASQWEDSLESDITVKQRVSEKIHKDKNRLTEEKRFQDGLIYQLMTRIFHLENELDKMDTQIELKEQEREDLAQVVAQGNTNIEAIATEYRCLMRSWNAVVVRIGNRDKIVSCLQQEQFKLEEEFKSVMAEIKKVKKMSKKEMQTNEELTVIKDRVQLDIQNCQATTDIELTKRDAILKEMNEIQAIIFQTEADSKKVIETNAAKKQILAGVIREYDKLDSQKCILEEDILNKLENKVTNDKSVSNLNSDLRNIKTKNRELEISIANCENKISKLLTEIETQKWSNKETQAALSQVEAQTDSLEEEVERFYAEFKKQEFAVSRKQREMDLLNGKLYELIQRTAGDTWSPLAVKISALEKNNDALQDEIKKMQKFWLREQTNLLNVSQERQQQIQNNHLLGKQILILEQKNLKLSDELDSLHKQEGLVSRNIHILQNRLTILSDRLYKKKGLKTSLDKGVEVVRQEFVFRLKEAEMDCLKLKEEISEIEEMKIDLSNKLIELNREFLEWDKKYKIAKETKETIHDEKSQEGEVGRMRAEIHRMHVRYTQLKKAQDKLVQDLEHCVSRRDTIIMGAEAREKRVKGGLEKTRINFQRKLDDLRNKNKQLENEIENMREKIRSVEGEDRAIDEEYKSIQFEIKRVRSEFEEMTQAAEEAQTRKQMHFEHLIQLQKKLNLYVELSKDHKPYLPYKSDSSIVAEFDNQKNINMKLMQVVENLMVDFPQHNHELGRILNTLKLPMYVVFSYK